MDAGADFIITQVCFSSETFLNFVKKCRSAGITIPIIPGIFIPPSYKSLQAMCRISQVPIPDINGEYRALKDEDVNFRKYALEKAYQMINEIFNNDYEKLNGVHFFSLNNFIQIKEIINRFDFNDSE